MAEGKYEWHRYAVNRKTDCQTGPTKCCVPILADKGKGLLDVPDEARITGDMRYTDTDSHWDPEPKHVTVEYYYPSAHGYSTKYYFTMSRDYEGHYYNKVDYQDGETTNNGQHLAVCVLQVTGLADGRTSYTLETYADVRLN